MKKRIYLTRSRGPRLDRKNAARQTWASTPHGQGSLNNKAKVGPTLSAKLLQILGGARGGAFGVAFDVGPFF
jgi:hypothetical protein